MFGLVNKNGLVYIYLPPVLIQFSNICSKVIVLKLTMPQKFKFKLDNIKILTAQKGNLLFIGDHSSTSN